MYLKCLQLLSLISLTICHHVNSNYYKESRIVGGTDEEIENAPWQISLQYKENHICGGSIYSETIIITAAHCVFRIPKDQLKIRAGSSKNDEGGTLIEVADVISHKGFNMLLKSNDVAVLRLAEPLTFGTSVKAIPLAKKSPGSNEKATFTGWGSTRYGQRPSSQLQSTQLKILSRFGCTLAFFPYPTGTVICAQSRSSGACSGDSGGPLVVNEELVGIASMAKLGCRGPSAYADVAKLQKWILSAIEKISEDNSSE